MGVQGARRTVVGVALLVAVPVALLQEQGTAATARFSVVEGAVEADGTAPAPSGWRVEHPARGYYVLHAPAQEATLDVSTWDGDAEVVINPLGDGAVAVTFTDGGQPTDTRFVWRALVTG